MKSLAALFANDETAVDSVVWCTFIAMLGLLAFEAWKIYHEPASFSPMSFGTATATIVGAGGGIKTCRERFKRDEQPH